tara:strand:+ start:260 stop:820 length:561 start_codon:yes stop_codon:yes gene_type:complete
MMAMTTTTDIYRVGDKQRPKLLTGIMPRLIILDSISYPMAYAHNKDEMLISAKGAFLEYKIIKTLMDSTASDLRLGTHPISIPARMDLAVMRAQIESNIAAYLVQCHVGNFKVDARKHVHSVIKSYVDSHNAKSPAIPVRLNWKHILNMAQYFVPSYQLGFFKSKANHLMKGMYVRYIKEGIYEAV